MPKVNGSPFNTMTTPTAHSVPLPLGSIDVPGHELVQFSCIYTKTGTPVPKAHLGRLIAGAHAQNWIWAEMVDETYGLHLIWVPWEQAVVLDPAATQYTGRLEIETPTFTWYADGDI